MKKQLAFLIMFVLIINVNVTFAEEILSSKNNNINTTNLNQSNSLTNNDSKNNLVEQNNLKNKKNSNNVDNKNDKSVENQEKENSPKIKKTKDNDKSIQNQNQTNITNNGQKQSEGTTGDENKDSNKDENKGESKDNNRESIVNKQNQQSTQSQFTDIKESDWFYNNVMEMVNLGIVKGYPDGTFKPKKSVKADEFIKMVLVAFKYEVPSTDNPYWATEYIKLAEKEGIINNNIISNYRQEITREQVTKVVTNTLYKSEEKPSDLYKDYIINAIKDYEKITDDYKQNIIDCYNLGIMQGNTQGKVNPQDSITRAETTAVILRMINKDKRLECKFENETDSENPNTFVITDSKIDHTYIAPIFNGKPMQEMIDVAYALKKGVEKSKGAELYVSSLEGEVIGLHGFETQKKNDFYCNPENLGVDKALLRSEYLDFRYKVDFTDYSTKYKPYELNLWKHTGGIEDERYRFQGVKYKEYFLEYYREPFEEMFKILFEDDFDKAWELFCKALSDRSSKQQLVKTIINDRYVGFSYGKKGVHFVISLKGNSK